ncbi:hypothetical protein N7472_005980 [Penicillium cf. griseofulvum]|uniref:beta-glucosidase n=1 Tax=Penicillium cf. griseofulvum TaxID=2972120 RepID=A0A9W9MGC0_9EURO|nr:hypothetical protein N7472_005980 [Penicillium cf. griseofulvum]KAJ5431531.1 hypothetical protein N7445_009263 [Penicillium cf. griseofulvum]
MSDGDIPPSFKGKVYSYRVTGVVIPKISGQYTFSIANTGKAKLFVDDQLLIDNTDWTTITSEKDEDAMMQRAIQSTRESDVVILIVSHNKDSKGEGGDRTNMELPGRTNELVSSVCAANPNTIVVVQAACATAMPWANQAGAIVLGWECRDASIVIKNEELGWYDEKAGSWRLDSGTYTFFVGTSARDIDCERKINMV